MRIIQILAHNFVIYKSLNIRFPTNGVIGIKGRNLDKPSLDTNAVGKTLILDMVSYAWYGEVLRKKAANVIGPHANDMILSVAFYIDRLGKTVIIKREKKGAVETVKVKIDGKMYKGRPRKIQPMIDRLIGIEWLTFQNCILYGDSKDNNFIYVSHSKRIEILAEISGILHLREARKLINPDLKEAEKELAHTEGRIETLKESQERAKKNLEYHKEKLDNIEEVIESKKSFDDGLIKDLMLKYDKINEEEINAKIKNFEFNIKKYEECKEDLEQKINEIKPFNPQKRLDKVMKEKTRIETIRQEKEREIEEIEESGKCPMCYTDVSDDLINRIKENLPSISKRLLERESDEKSMIEELKRSENNLSDIINLLNQNKINLENSQKDLIRKRELKERIKHLKEKQRSQEKMNEEYQKNVDKSQREYDELTNQVSKVIFREKKQKQDRNLLEYWKRKFSPKEAEAELIVDLIKKLQSFANRYIHKLTDGSISIYMSPERETLSGIKKQEMNIDIIENDKVKDFDLYSGGQKNRIEKAIRLGLMNLLDNDINFKLFDEIGKDLSSKGYEEVIKLMKEVFYGQQILLVTNDTESKKLFDHLITVTLKNGESMVECSWR